MSADQDTGSLATVTCVEPRPTGEAWQLRFADLCEVAVYCPTCAEREFGSQDHAET